FACWFRPSAGFFTVNSWNRIVGHSTATNQNEIQLMRYSTHRNVVLALSNASGQPMGSSWSNVISRTELQEDTWYHITGIWSKSAGYVALYINGVKEAEKPWDNVYAPTVYGQLAVGYHPNTSRRANGLIDELLILPYAASAEEIRAWYELDAPFYDTAEGVGIDTPEGNVIEVGRRGILITPAGFPQRGAHLDGRMLGFWDVNNIPAIGIGDVRQMAQQLGSS